MSAQPSSPSISSSSPWLALALALAWLLPAAAPSRAEPGPSPLVGLWHAVSSTDRDGGDATPNAGGMELEFTADGFLLQTFLLGSSTDGRPIRYRGPYTFEPPDVVAFSYPQGGTRMTRRHRFWREGQALCLEGLKTGRVWRLRRIERSELEPPRDVPELPPTGPSAARSER